MVDFLDHFGTLNTGRLRNFFLSQEFVWFFGPKRLRDFHCPKRLLDFVPRGCEFPISQVPRFPSSQVPKIPISQDLKFTSSQVPKFPSSKVLKFPRSQVPKFFPSSQVLNFPSPQVPKFQSSNVPKFPSQFLKRTVFEKPVLGRLLLGPAKRPHKSSSLSRESILKLPGGCQLL